MALMVHNAKTLALLLQKASVGWGTPGEGKEPLLQGVDFMVSRGHRILVLGANGAGKTTLLKVLAGCSCSFSTATCLFA